VRLFNKVELVPWSKLVPADYNPRRMSRRKRDELRASLLRFGFTVPMVVERGTMTVIGGHQRLVAVQEMVEAGAIPKDQKVPVIFRDDLGAADVRKLNVGLNEIEGEFDVDGLAALIASIEELDGWRDPGPACHGPDGGRPVGLARCHLGARAVPARDGGGSGPCQLPR
jgi:ParB-like chromosome segregation protein Spo0J